ncbi:MAG: hypothetical protein L0H73_05625 [Nitrococcus sp.]|nr:hypothetical protein [Nitrococcus sp.]
MLIARRAKAHAGIELFRWLDTLLGNIETAISGRYHSFDQRTCAFRCLAEIAYRFKCRFELIGPRVRAAVAFMRASPGTQGVIEM